MDESDAGAGRATRVVITTTATLNGGDAALIDAQLQIIRQALPGAAITVFDQQAEVGARYRPRLGLRPSLVWPRNEKGTDSRLRWSIRLLRLTAAAAALRSRAGRIARLLAPTAEDLEDLELYATADLVMTNAGTMLVDQYSYEPRLVDYSIAHILGVPILHFTQTMGPFPRRWTNPWLRWLLSHAELVMVRGDESKKHLNELGVPADKVVEAADPVFVLADDAAIVHGRTRRLPGSGAKVGISVRNWPYFDGQEAFERAVADLCTALVVDRGCEVLFVSTCQGIPEYWADDAVTARRIVERLPEGVRSRVTVAADFHDTDDLRRILAELDVVVSTRLHLAILALVSGTPAIPINYEPKSREVYARLGAPELTIDIDKVDQGRLRAHVMGALDRVDDRRESLFASVASEGASAAGAVTLVDELISSRARESGDAPG